MSSILVRGGLPAVLLPVLLSLPGCQMNWGAQVAPGSLIRAIERDLAADRLIQPARRNALEKIAHLARIAPRDRRVSYYRRRAVGRLVQLARHSFAQRDYEKTESLLGSALGVLPRHSGALSLLDKLRDKGRGESLSFPGRLFEVEKVATKRVSNSRIVRASRIPAAQAEGVLVDSQTDDALFSE